jgi:hypothetical protein
MNLNSRIFDSIKIKSRAKPVKAAPVRQVCDHPGCAEPGEHKAPMGRLREGHYFSFCLDHVREYNATYNYFNGMSDDAVSKYQKEAVVGHRPTWSMGVNRAAKGHREEGGNPTGFTDHLSSFRRNEHMPDEPRGPRYGVAIMKALAQLGLDDNADANAVKTRYKDLVKRLHPDANGGDRANEDKLREIIVAYNYLKSVKLA